MELVPHVLETTGVKVRLKDGGHAPLTFEAVAKAAVCISLHKYELYDVLADIGGKFVSALDVVRQALGGQDPVNTNEAEKALRELGFRIYVSRRFDKETGDPVRLTREQIKNSAP
ncbi:hypothetical protein ACMATS_05930 [Streptoverticillium reticulum]|uniref:hypothetical protein n=1 Tax=Streptoverticillium reticulum TaxID=1433415 RepID=UPI0039BF1F70